MKATTAFPGRRRKSMAVPMQPEKVEPPPAAPIVVKRPRGRPRKVTR